MERSNECRGIIKVAETKVDHGAAALMAENNGVTAENSQANLHRLIWIS
jgi:hypothetical protein